jgi:hypothetical protein
MGGPEEEVGGLRIFVDKCKVARTEVVDSGSSVFFVIVAVATLTSCIIIESCCHRPWGSICAGTHVSCATGQESVIMSAYESGITPV